MQTEINESFREGHTLRLYEEINSYLEEFFENNEIPRPDDIDEYIKSQVNMILTEIYKEDVDPETIDPNTTLGVYYRESIKEYGTVYNDYQNEPEQDEQDEHFVH